MRRDLRRDPTVHPGATEIVGNNVGQDCNGHELCWPDLDSARRDVRRDPRREIYGTMPGAIHSAMPDAIYSTMPDAIYSTMPDAIYSTMPDTIYGAMPGAIHSAM